MAIDLILGTAGHIDHGKTALVKALTGVDTDRLPAEKQRGISIELGFAQLVLAEARLGVVDVPGHERFVRTMLAGATGIDLALLVVAANESIKPQTREHLEILRLLDPPAGVIALTKCDLVEPDWLELVTAEVRELVGKTFLRDAPLIATSARSGQGLAELRAALGQVARNVASTQRRRAFAGPFRMAIDRHFTVAGQGTVVTGSVASGAVRVGDVLIIEPGGCEVRVRGMQHHDQPVAEIQRGQRAALNLAGVAYDQITRGQEIAAPGHLQPTLRLTVELQVSPHAARPLKNHERVRLHLGTAEFVAAVALLEVERVAPGETAVAQLVLSSPAVAVWGQPFVLRQLSPTATIGGGRVLVPVSEKIRRNDATRIARLKELGSSEPLIRAGAALYLSGLADWQPSDLARTAGIFEGAAVAEQLSATGTLLKIPLSPTRRLALHRDVLAQLAQQLVATLKKLHTQSPLKSRLARARLIERFAPRVPPPVVEAALSQLAEAGRIELTPDTARLAGQGPSLSINEQQTLEQLLAQIHAAGMQPPTIAELQTSVARNKAAVPQLLQLAAAAGEVVFIGESFVLHTTAAAELRAVVQRLFDHQATLSVSQIRQALGTTRKYAVPFCEHFDRIGFTVREGDTRRLAEETRNSIPRHDPGEYSEGKGKRGERGVD